MQKPKITRLPYKNRLPKAKMSKPPKCFQRLISLRRVIAFTGYTKVEIHKLMAKGHFPSFNFIDERTNGWDEDAVQNHVLQKLEQKRRF